MHRSTRTKRRVSPALAAAAALAACSGPPSPSPELASSPATSVAATTATSSGAGAASAADPTASCPAGFRPPRAGLHEGFAVAGRARRFYLRLPEDSTLASPRPLLVFFHGTNGEGDVVARFGFADRLVARGFVVVGPYGEDLGTVWPEWDAMRTAGDRARPNEDVDFFDRLVGCLRASLPIAADRIFVAGMSAGGIMTNRLLRERSPLLAGGIVGSGIFDLTEPAAPAPLDPMAVIVTTGGDDDAWGGENAGKELPSIQFTEQAALASGFYEAAPGVHQVSCQGRDLGHRWLSAADDLFVGFLEAHPKGRADAPGYALPALPDGAEVDCSEEAVRYRASAEVVCPERRDPRCRKACQMVADCVVENVTVRPIFEPQLPDFGFFGADREDCSDCVTQCERDGTGAAADAAVLDCLTGAPVTCGSGIAGALPLTRAVDGCCAGQAGSRICARMCRAIRRNTTVAPFFPACAAFR